MIKEFLTSNMFSYILLGIIGLTIGIKYFYFMSKSFKNNANCEDEE